MNNYIQKMNNTQKILLHLAKNQNKTYSMLSLSKELSIPYASFYRAIKSLKDIIIIEKIGQTNVIKLNSAKEELIPLLTLASIVERDEFLSLQSNIKIVANTLKTKDVVLLFGSYAKGKETNKSDVDIMVINSNGKKTISFSQTELLLKKEINPMFFTFKELNLMLNEPTENVGKQALNKHLIQQKHKDYLLKNA